MFRDLTGLYFYRWKVLEFVGRSRTNVYWNCKCLCGVEKNVNQYSLLRGTSKSCGCAKKHNLTGNRFGRLLVKKFDGMHNGRSFWLCVCDCGNTTIVQEARLLNRHTKSCGCLGVIARRECNTTHGKSGSKAYRAWSAIKSRCTNKNVKEYVYYGARGITYDPRWENFENFLEDMGEPTTPDLEIDRTDNGGIYTKENCRWTTKTENLRNKRTNRVITFAGKTQLLTDWAREVGITHSGLIYRLDIAKMPLEVALQKFIPSNWRELNVSDRSG